MEQTQRIIIGLIGSHGPAIERVAGALAGMDSAYGNFERIDCADTLRREVATAFGMTPGELATYTRQNALLDSFRLSQCACQEFVDTVLYAQHQEFGLDADDLRDLLEAPQHPLQVVQWWDTTYRRRRDEGCWLDQVRAVLQSRQTQNFVVTGWSHPDDLAMLKAFNGKSALVRGSVSESTLGMPISHEPMAQNQFDYVIDADVAPEMLQFLVSSLIEVMALVDAAPLAR